MLRIRLQTTSIWSQILLTVSIVIWIVLPEIMPQDKQYMQYMQAINPQMEHIVG